MIKLFNTKEEAVKQLPLSALKKFKIEGKEIAIVCTNSGIKVFNNTCPHDGASLAAGEVAGDSIVCPWHHHYHFDLKTGACRDFDCDSLELYEVVENEEGIFIGGRR